MSERGGSKRAVVVSGIAAFMACLFLLAGQSFAQGKVNAQPKTAAEAIESLVWANRILVLEGIFDYLGHISVRNPENPKTFFIG